MADEPELKLFIEIKGVQHVVDFDDWTIDEVEQVEDYLGQGVSEARLERARTRIALAAGCLTRLDPRTTFEENIDEVRKLKAGEVAFEIRADESEPKADGKRPTKRASGAAKPADAGTPA